MKNIIVKSLLVAVVMLTLCACGMKYPELEYDATKFQADVFMDENDPEDAGYLSIEYKKRTYIIYGTTSRSVKESDINTCEGYVIEDESVTSVPNPNGNSIRVYTLTGDLKNNYLLIHTEADDLMEQPEILRAIDTKGQNIETPSIVKSLDYNYWK